MQEMLPDLLVTDGCIYIAAEIKAALIFGPKHVIVIAGINKVEPNLDAAILRAKNYAAALTCLIFKQDYASWDELAKVADEANSHLVVTNKQAIRGRIKVILVGESLGY